MQAVAHSIKQPAWMLQNVNVMKDQKLTSGKHSISEEVRETKYNT